MTRAEREQAAAGPRVTFTEWLAGRPFGDDLPPIKVALALEVAWNTALRRGRESEPPGPGDWAAAHPEWKQADR